MRLRWFGAWLAAALAGTQVPVQAQEVTPLSTCIAALRKDLRAHPDVSAQTFDRYTRDVQDLRPVIENATRAQPEFEIPMWDYLARRVDAQRIADGREVLQQQATALREIAARHHVDPAIIVAVLGIETDYGRVADRYPVVDATLSRSCLAPNSRERKQHFFDALWLLQEQVVQPETFRGSWAGAFGMTQFMPGTFRGFMRDGPGSPPADIFGSMPDALATTARYLRGLGWMEGVPWGFEVRVPPELASREAQEADHGCLQAERPAGRCRTLAAWGEAGVVRVDGTPLSGAQPAALLMPAGAAGPAWLVTSNYRAIWRYNRADAYALAIGLLSDAMRDLPATLAPWPTDDPGVSRLEFRELQQLLKDRGHCEVSVDGAEGPRTGAAIKAEEGRLGWPQTGRAGVKLLAALRAERTEAATCTAQR